MTPYSCFLLFTCSLQVADINYEKNRISIITNINSIILRKTIRKNLLIISTNIPIIYILYFTYTWSAATVHIKFAICILYRIYHVIKHRSCLFNVMLVAMHVVTIFKFIDRNMHFPFIISKCVSSLISLSNRPRMDELCFVLETKHFSWANVIDNNF